MGREDYNACMVPWIKGKPDEDRRLSFCMGAKICSGKAETPEQARQICMEKFSARTGEDVHLSVDGIKVKVDGKEVVISAEVFQKLCGCKRK